jgi:hypothetical protein
MGSSSRFVAAGRAGLHYDMVTQIVVVAVIVGLVLLLLVRLNRKKPPSDELFH